MPKLTGKLHGDAATELFGFYQDKAHELKEAGQPFMAAIAVWKASRHLLSEREGIEIASPNGAIRAARRLGSLSDADAEAAIKIGRDCNLAIHMYRGRIGEEIEERLASHAAVLRRWLEALKTAGDAAAC